MAATATSIPHYRARVGLTQVQLGRALGIDEATMSRIETGVVVPTAEQVDKISEQLGVIPSVLFSKAMLALVAERVRAAS